MTFFAVSNDYSGVLLFFKQVTRQHMELAAAGETAVVIVLADGKATFLGSSSRSAATVAVDAAAVASFIAEEKGAEGGDFKEKYQFTGRDESSMLSAAVEWFALSQCDLAVSCNGSRCIYLSFFIALFWFSWFF